MVVMVSVWVVVAAILATVDVALCMSDKSFPLRRSWLALIMHPFMYLEKGEVVFRISSFDVFGVIIVSGVLWPFFLPGRLVGIVLNLYQGWRERRAKQLNEPPKVQKPLSALTVDELMVELGESAKLLKEANDRFQEVKFELQEKRLRLEANIEAAKAADPEFERLLADDDDLAQQLRRLEVSEGYRGVRS